MVDFDGEMQIMGSDLTQRNGCATTAITSHVVVGIVEKWWRQHISDFDGGATCAPGLELRGESLGLANCYTWQWRCFSYVVTLLKALLGYARTDSSG
jgi:hypothetical protein